MFANIDSSKLVHPGRPRSRSSCSALSRGMISLPSSPPLKLSGNFLPGTCLRKMSKTVSQLNLPAKPKMRWSSSLGRTAAAT